jgi:hypothetical protein
MRSLAHHVRNAGAAALVMAVCGSLRASGQEVVTALDRTLQKTHMRQEATHVTLSTTSVSAFAPTTIQCGNPTCSVRVEVSSQFFNVTSAYRRLYIRVPLADFASDRPSETSIEICPSLSSDHISPYSYVRCRPSASRGVVVVSLIIS